MRALLQRVTSSAVRIDGETVGEIEQGLNILLCVMDGDTAAEAVTAASEAAWHCKSSRD